MELTFNRLFTYLIPYLLGGISVTLSVSFLALVIGAVGGLLLAFLRVYGGRAVQVLMTIFSAVFRAIPQTILLLLLYFVIAGSINISAYWAGTLSLAVISCVYQLEIFRPAPSECPISRRSFTSSCPRHCAGPCPPGPMRPPA